MSEKKAGSTDFATEVERLKAAGKLPKLEEVFDAVEDARKKCAPKILKAREQASESERR